MNRKEALLIAKTYSKSDIYGTNKEIEVLIPVLKKMILRYSEVTKADIKKASKQIFILQKHNSYNMKNKPMEWSMDVMSVLTGLGNSTKCLLCIAAKENCRKCYQIIRNHRCYVQNTYTGFYGLRSYIGIYRAIQDRIEYIRNFIMVLEAIIYLHPDNN